MLCFRKIDPVQDGTQLYNFLQSQGNCQTLPYQPRFLQQDDFFNWLVNQLRGCYHDFFLIEDSASDCIRGFLLAFDYRPYDGNCQVTGYADCDINHLLLGQFVDFLFREYPLNKVFLEAVDSQEVLIRAAEELGFIREAVLSAYKFISGDYQDMLILGLNPQKRREVSCHQIT